MERILVIEDDKNIRESVTELLEWEGYQVLTADNGDMGLSLAISDHPDLILCDMMMPGRSGIEVLHALKCNTEIESIPFIFISAMAQKSEIEKSLSYGANEYIVKPFRARDLFGKIETILGMFQEARPF